MYFNEKLVDLGDGRYLALSEFDLNMVSCYLPRDQVGCGYAYVAEVGQAQKIDVRPWVAHHLPASAKDANQAYLEAKRMLLQAGQYPKNSSDGNRFLAYAKQAQWQAKQCETDAWVYPDKSFFARNGLGLVSFRANRRGLTRHESWLVDVLNQTILREDFIQCNWLAINDEGTQALRLQMRQMHESSSFEQLFCFDQMQQDHYEFTGKLEVVSLPQGQPLCAMKPEGHVIQAAFWRGFWLLTSAGDNEQSNLLVYDAHGHLVEQYPFKGHPTCLDANSEIPCCAVGLSGGNIVLIDLVQHNQQLIRPHIGVSRTAYVTLHLDPLGQFLASVASDSVTSQKLMLTDILATPPRSLEITNLQGVTIEIDREGSLIINKVCRPDFGFIGGELALLKNGELIFPNRSDNEIWRDSAKAISAMPPPAPAEATETSRAFEALLAQYGLMRVAKELTDYLTPSVQLKTTKLNAAAKAVGGSRLGGSADLAALEQWPVWPPEAKRPMVFVGQFNLAELATVLPHSRLPQTGLLSFFVAREPEGWMKVPYEEDTQSNQWVVMHQPDISVLQTFACPEQFVDEEETSCGVRFAAVKSAVLPSEDSPLIAALHLNEVEAEGYLSLLEVINGEQTEDDMYGLKLLGYPGWIQDNDLEIYCQLAADGKNPYDLPQEPVLMDQLLAQAKDWTQLFQVVSDEDFDPGLGDFILYWFIRREALASGDFSQTWIASQC